MKSYKITFLPNNVTIDVDPSKFPYGETGNPGSVMDIALSHNVDLEHVCGGNVACSTCHVIVEKGFNTCSAVSSDENDQLDNANGRTPQSRLSCQCVPSGDEDIVVRIP